MAFTFRVVSRIEVHRRSRNGTILGGCIKPLEQLVRQGFRVVSAVASRLHVQISPTLNALQALSVSNCHVRARGR
eukprot:4778664-Amphidinium_carterae.2